MRFAWQTPDVDGTAARLAAVLGIAPRVDGETRSFDLSGLGLDVTAAPTEGLRRLDDAAAAPAAGPSLRAAAFATVDFERAAAEHGWTLTPLPADRVLGASAWAVAEEPSLVVVEPNTEGRVAASLARFAEGYVALYVAADGPLAAAREAAIRRGAGVTAIADGPFGRSFALSGGRIWGPHLVVVGSAARPAAPATIAE